MIFRDRQDAGRQLAKRLMKYANLQDVIVLGIPRGGVPVAFEIATALHAPLDIFLSRKLGVPGQEELAFGAVAAGDGRFLDQEIVQAAGISAAQIEQITRATRATLDQRARLYRGDLPSISVEGRTVILVDDGIATGASVYAAVHALRQMKPRKLVVAVPVAPISTSNWLRSSVDELVVAYSPEYFYAVGQFYDRFSQTTDEEVVALLRQATRHPAEKAARPTGQHADPPSAPVSAISFRDVTISVGGVIIEGRLTIPKGAEGIVLFAHGSGSSRHSPRNRYVAEMLHAKGLATLLFDLLTREEEAIDRLTAELRFNITFLAKRLIGVTGWVRENADTGQLALGYFGASTGAAAALVAAARLPRIVDAVVSRGGRPDLAGESLTAVQAPTLLIVGGRDEVVLTLNRQALAALKSPVKRLAIVAGATHLFEEPGTLEEAARLAADWFVHYLVPAGSSELNVVGTAATHN